MGVLSPFIMPEVFIGLSTLLLLLFGLFRSRIPVYPVTIGALSVCLFTAFLLSGIYAEKTVLFSNLFITDSFAVFIKILILLGLFLSLLLSVGYLKEEGALRRFEYPVLILLSGLGMMVMASANDFLTAYIGIELQSFSLYILAAFRRDTIKSAESGVKYYVLGALASGFLLYGISLIYGFSGTTNFESLSQESEPSMPLLIGMVFILSAFAFKLSSVPFHMWTPDVYEGAPTASTAFFALVPKIAGFALLIRLLTGPFAAFSEHWVQIIIVIALASMVWSAFAGLKQKNIKRLMAYSAIGHMGYAMLGVLANTPEGISSVLVYLTIYMIMTAGVFGVILNMRKSSFETDQIDDLSGLSKNYPFLAYMMALFLFSMTGIPPLAGFFAKLFIFKAAISSGYILVSVIGILSSVVAAYYYLRIIKVMFFDLPKEPFDMTPSFSRSLVILFSFAFVTLFIIYPAPLINISYSAVQCLFPGA